LVERSPRRPEVIPVTPVARQLRSSSPSAIESAASRHSDLRTEKIALRKSITAERQRRSDPDRRAAAEGLRDMFLETVHQRQVRRVALYVSRPEEPGTLPLRTALAAAAIEVLLPRPAGHGQLTWIKDTMVLPETERCELAASQPRGRCASLERTEIMIVPCLAVDTLGRRLGRGYDGYDKVLPHLNPSQLILGAVYGSELFDAAVESIPEQPHGVGVDAALTPCRILPLPHDGTRQWSNL
jgi:5-formyltetrahydrofolate cyclo-ligase